MSIISVKNTFLNVADLSQCLPLLCRHKSMPAMHVPPHSTTKRAKVDFDKLSDSTRCPSSPGSSRSIESDEIPAVERRNKMAKYVKQKADCHKTTVMLRNVPCKFSQEQLMEEISLVNTNFNFLYLPSSKKAVGNLGYAFVNFTTNDECVHFLEAFQGHCFASAPRSKKRAEVTYATMQGFKENVRFFKRSRVGKSQNAPFIGQN